MLAIPPFGASSNIALWRADFKPPVELVVGDLAAAGRQNEGGVSMDLKAKITRGLSQATSDKTELNKMVLKYKKRFDEANAALGGKKKSKK